MTGEKSNPLSFLLRSFQYRNYRLYFGGQSVSQIGTWIQTIALSWLVYSLTGSALYLGIVGFIGQIPILVLSFLTGVLMDRWNRHRTFIATQVLTMILAFVLSALVLTGRIEVWHIIVLSLLNGLVASFELTSSQTFLYHIIEKKEDIGNAIALNSMLVNLARMLGPSIAGILIASIGEGLCFFVNGASYLPVIAALLLMRVKPQPPAASKRNILKGLQEGINYACGSTPIISIILLQSLISLIGMPFQVLMPVFVQEILNGGPHALGFIMGCSGVGAIVATLYLATRRDPFGLVKLVPVAAAILGAGLIASSLSRLTVLSMFFALFTGFGAILLMAVNNTVLQTIVADDKRARVMSLYTISFLGIYPFGNLLAGGLANLIGVPNEFMLSGICCLVGSLVFASRLGAIKAGIKRPSQQVSS